MSYLNCLLFCRLSDASGKLDFSKTKSGSISKYDFDTNVSI